MAINKLLEGEQCLVRSVDKKVMVTTHRLMKTTFSWVMPARKEAVMLEDIVTWEVKQAGQRLYLCLSIALALAACFHNSCALFSGFFLILYIVTRYRKIHIRTHDNVLVLPLEDIGENGMKVLVDTVRMAQRNRMEQLKKSKSTPV